MKSIGEKIRRLRELRGLTQTALAEKADVNIATISFIENGRSRPRHRTLQRISTALGVDLHYFSEIADTPDAVLDHLPVLIRDFVLDPVNLPYLTVALTAAEKELDPLMLERAIEFASQCQRRRA